MMTFGRSHLFAATVAAMAALASGTALAQNLRNAGPPAELPPASFTSNQYVDSRGCVYIRAGIGGTTSWVPRVNRERRQLCGFQPSLLAGGSAPAPAPVAPLPEPEPTPAPAPVQAEAPAPAPEPAPTATPVARPAAQQVAARPTAAATATPAPAAPRTVTARPATVAAAAPAASPSPRVVTPEPTTPARRVITRAEACAGKFGIQPNMISQRTGQPVDCGPAPQQTASVSVAPDPAPATLTRAQACEGKFGIQPNLISQRTGQPIDCGPAPQRQVAGFEAIPGAQAGTPTTVRLTLAEACRRVEEDGASFRNAATGQPLDCGEYLLRGPGRTTTALESGSGNVLERIRRDLALPQTAYRNPLDGAPGSTFVRPAPNPGTRAALRHSTAPYSNPGLNTGARQVYRNPLDASPGGTTFVPNVNTSMSSGDGCLYAGRLQEFDGLPNLCGPQPRPNAAPAATTARAAATTRAQNPLQALLGQEEPPYSNPPVGFRLPEPTVPEGYARVWDDGRLNPNRGLPNTVRYATQPLAGQTEQTARVSTRTVAPAAPAVTQPRAEQISGHRYVQVGTFATRSQAQSVAQALRARGLPMRIGVYTQQGQEMRIVLAGPFANDRGLQQALGTARAAGYAGAFTRQ